MSIPLIVVSNREPYEHRREGNRLVCTRTDGGLTAALDPALQRLGGTWIAWGSGKADRDAVGPDSTVAVPPGAPRYRLRRVWLDEADAKGGYLGYANQVLWPLCHVTLDRIAYQQSYWDAYRRLNQRFCDAVLEEARRQAGIIWIHDFHLSLLPRLIRVAAPERVIALFWHIPWPGPDVFRILPERRDLLEGMLAADSLVFQTVEHAHAFADCAERFVGAEIGDAHETLSYQGRRIKLAAHPISVDYEAISRRALVTQINWPATFVKRRLTSRPEIRFGLGVDRVDYSKGLLKRLWALDDFFTRYPAYRGRFTFIQIAVPTRSEIAAYRRYAGVIRATVQEINDRHTAGGSAEVSSADAWRPIELHEGRITFNLLLAYYRLADLLIVSSVYDGMNLVAKEYVASRVDDTGVLLISQMAGASQELIDALEINPYDTERVADAIHRALEMSLAEQKQRMHAMRAYLKHHDVHRWVQQCLADAEACLSRPPPVDPSSVGVRKKRDNFCHPVSDE